MARARNIVIDGAYKGKPVIWHKDHAAINAGVFNKIALDTRNVVGYDVVDETRQKSLSSGVARGLIGGAIFGPIGLLAGGVSGKTNGIHKVIVTYNNGGQSLLEVDDQMYSLIVEKLALVMYQEPEQETSNGSFSVADEIMKLKQLADANIITQAEFEQKKQQLLK